MPTTVLFEEGNHRNLLLEDFGGGVAVQTNQHVIVHNGEGMILDPGGHKVYSKVLASTFKELKRAKLKHLFLSHQDPDIVAAVNGWLMTTDADAWVSGMWTRFIAHFGVDRLVMNRMKAIPDEGMTLNLGGVDLLVIPAHFLHSAGNFHLFDPVSKIYYSGDLGVSLGAPYMDVPDFEDHIQYMEGFHQRFMNSKKVMSAFANAARTLDIEIIAPQHGAMIRGKEMVTKFIDWADGFECGVDLMPETFNIPGNS